MILYFARHGEKKTDGVYNPSIKHTDPPLTAYGFKQAEALADYMKDRDIRAVYTSRYLRARQTAAPTAEMKSLPILEDQRIDEIDTGLIETLSYGEIERAYPEFWEEFQGHRRDVRFPGGETGRDVKTRQNAFLKDIQTKNENILVVSHDGYLRLLVCSFLGLPVYKRYLFKTDYCGLSIFEYREDEGKWKIRAYNQTIY
jgi:broad specificity phosphatase PhoE